MRKKLVAANWKMHGSTAFAQDYANALSQALKDGGAQAVEVVVFPPAVYLQLAAQCFADTGIAVGAQNSAVKPEGAYTGEIASEMLADCGCSHVLVGHSERRALYGENDEVVADKFEAALRGGLIPVLCVGETLEQRESGNTRDVVFGQLDAVANRVGKAGIAAAIIAYEPVWAIGTGRTATPEQAQDVHAAIRGYLGPQGAETRILYGGSVKAANARQLFDQPDVDGGLVGGASLMVDEFAAICGEAERS